MFINFIIELLTNSLFNYIFFLSGLFDSSNNIMFNLVDLETRNKIIELLVDRSGLNEETIHTNFDLNDQAMEALCELLDFKPINDNRYIFSIYNQRLSGVAEEYYKYYKPISVEKKYVDTFQRLENFKTLEEARNFLTSINGKRIAIYDSRTQSLFMYAGRHSYAEHNQIL